MNTLKMKIVDYEEASNSLLVTFASDETKNDVGSYATLAYQPSTMFPDIKDPQEIVKRVAIAGVHIADLQRIQEQFVSDPVTVNALKALKGQVLEYNVADLIGANNTNNYVPEENQMSTLKAAIREVLFEENLIK